METIHEAITFAEFPKIPRLNRECLITEKIDGTNAAVIVTADGQVGAQSRTRLITPDDDNFGFAVWVERHADALREYLGVGRHFGEWWGGKIQRGYGLTEKRFSLFNVSRWEDIAERSSGLLHCVPVLYRGPFSTSAVENAVADLWATGSRAAPGFTKPEGVVVFHLALNGGFKVTLEKDEEWKGKARG